MKFVILIFPDADSIVDFLLTYNPTHTEVNSSNLSITGLLSDAQIVAACTSYKAVMENSVVRMATSAF